MRFYVYYWSAVNSIKPFDLQNIALPLKQPDRRLTYWIWLVGSAGSKNRHQRELRLTSGVDFHRHLARGNFVHPVQDYDMGESLQPVQSLTQAVVDNNLRNDFVPLIVWTLWLFDSISDYANRLESDWRFVLKRFSTP